MKLAALVAAATLSMSSLVFAQGQTVVIKADTVLDGKGGTLTNTSLVVQGAKIANITPALADEMQMDMMAKGVVVTGVANPSQAARFGFREGDIVRAIEGETALGALEVHGRGTSHEVLSDVLAQLARRIESCLDEVTVADLCARAEQLGVARSGATRYVYAI